MEAKAKARLYPVVETEQGAEMVQAKVITTLHRLLASWTGATCSNSEVVASQIEICPNFHSFIHTAKDLEQDTKSQDTQDAKTVNGAVNGTANTTYNTINAYTAIELDGKYLGQQVLVQSHSVNMAQLLKYKNAQKQKQKHRSRSTREV